jgi:hypothetical protein
MKYSQPNNPHRHKLIDEEKGMRLGTTGISCMDELRDSLQKALDLEHFTIPPYLCALYSIQEGTNAVAAKIIRSVVVEEMLHMVMVANIMNALSFAPEINKEAHYPHYPNPLPFPGAQFKVNLLKFSKEAINTFLRIERPAASLGLGHPPSIGQFYASLRNALIEFEQRAKGTIFTGDHRRQVAKKDYYGSGGKLIAVHNLQDALAALDEIVGQGEGIDGTIDDGDEELFGEGMELAHYFRFNEVFHERAYKTGDGPQDEPSGPALAVDWNAVYNMEPNPKMGNIQDRPWLVDKMRSFNKTYKTLLDTLQDACNGSPAVLKSSIPIMHQLREHALELMKIPSGHGNYTTGPSFEYVE